MAYLLILLWNLATLVPIWLGWWDVFAVLGLYWFENVCTGIFQHLRIRDCERSQPTRDDILVLVFFGLVMGGVWQAGPGWGWSALAIAATQYAGYRATWRAREAWKHTTPGRLMAEPYARVLVLHLIVIGGGFLALSAESPQAILVAFALVKLGVEWLAQFLWSRFATKAQP